MKDVSGTDLIEQSIEACVHVKFMSARAGKSSPIPRAMKANRQNDQRTTGQTITYPRMLSSTVHLNESRDGLARTQSKTQCLPNTAWHFLRTDHFPCRGGNA